MTFANEAAMLRAFIITYDEIGWDDETSSIATMFVDWMIEPPRFHVTLQQLAAHEKLNAMTERTGSMHPCWDGEHMPFFLPDGLVGLPPIAEIFFGLR